MVFDCLEIFAFYNQHDCASYAAPYPGRKYQTKFIGKFTSGRRLKVLEVSEP